MPYLKQMAALAALAVAALVPALFAGAAIAAPPGGEIRDVGGPTAVADSYLVVLKDAAVPRSQVPERAQALAASHHGAVGHVYTNALRGFSIRVDESQARRLAARDEVAYVAQNHTVSTADIQPKPPSWGLDRIDQRALPMDDLYSFPFTASNVTAYVIDTGIRITHTDFGGRARNGFDFVNNDPIANDCNGHGTHVAGTLGGAEHGVAKAVQLVAVRVLDCKGYGTLAQVVAGVDWVTANAVRPAVANMSLGFIGESTVLEAAVRNSIASGVTYVVAAGNYIVDACEFSPAREAQAITVGATGDTDAREFFSNFGRCLDIFAPGGDITSAWATSDNATAVDSGTSMAAPHVAGAAALILQANPGLTPQQVRDTIVSRGTSGVVTDAGLGSPDLLLHSPPAATVTTFLADPSGEVFTASGNPWTGWGSWSTVSQGSTLPGAPVTALVTGSDQVRLFLANPDGEVFTVSGSPAGGWGPWSSLQGSTLPGAPITAVTTGPDEVVTVFLADREGTVYAGTGSPSLGWGWSAVGADFRTRPGAPITAVPTVPDEVTLFATDAKGQVFTTSGSPNTGWARWTSVSEGSTLPGAKVTAVLTAPDEVTLFLADPKGEVFTASGSPAGGWGPWLTVSQGSTLPGAPVTAVLTAPDEVTLFLADPKGEVFTASGSPAGGWGPWLTVSQGSTLPGAPVTAALTGPEEVTLFLADPSGEVFTASGNPWTGWGPWLTVSQGSTLPGAPVAAVVTE
ncbi:S8 family serine peptidase [Catellatospora coxensis]